MFSLVENTISLGYKWRWTAGKDNPADLASRGYSPEQLQAYMRIQEGGIPNSYQQARTSIEWDKWKEAMNAEYESLMKNNTWSLEDLPNDKNPIKCKWVYALTRDADGNILKYKARLVAKGFSQQAGIDYEETFAPVVKYTSMQILLAVAAKLGLRVTQLDAVTAFLNGNLEEEIYLQQPEKFNNGLGKFCRLRKSLYGLKQASRFWNKTINAEFKKIGLERARNDQCIYYRFQVAEHAVFSHIC